MAPSVLPISATATAQTIWSVTAQNGIQAAAVVAEPVLFVTGTAVFAGMLDPTGTATIQVAVPNFPSLEHVTVWCQAVSGNSLPLRASTIAGGVVR